MALSTGNPFLDALMAAESNGQNIYSKVDPDVAGENSRSQGYFQINNPTWGQFGADSKYSNAMSAPFDEQTRVVKNIPFSRFGQRTVDMLHKQFGDFDNKATVGTLANQFSGGATTTPGTTANTSAANPPATAAAPSQSPFQMMQGGNVLGGLGALAKSPGMGNALQNIKPSGEQQISPMQAPNIQPHQVNPEMAQMVMAQAAMRAKPPQGVPGPGGVGGLGGMGGMPAMNPQMMMQSGMNPYTDMAYG